MKSETIEQTVSCIAARVRERRERLGVSREDLARALDITLAGYGHKEIGRRPFTAPELGILARALRCSPAYFYGEGTAADADRDDFLRLYLDSNAEQQETVRRVALAVLDR